MVMNNTKMDQKKKKSLAKYRRRHNKMKKAPYYNGKRLFLFRKFGLLSASFLKSNDLGSSFDEEQIKAKYQGVFFEISTLKFIFLKKQF